MKVQIDRDLCVGIGNCVAVAPSVFELDAENKAVVLDYSSVSDDKLMSAAESCPVNAVIVLDDQDNQLYP
jgi:ferredoxin